MFGLQQKIVAIFVVAIAWACIASAHAFTSTEGKFIIDFPADPQFTKSDMKNKAGNPYVLNSWQVDKDGGWWAVASSSYSTPITETFDEPVKGFVSGVKGKLISQSNIQQRGIKGREAVVTTPQFVFRLRAFFIDKKYWQIVYGGPLGTESEAKVIAFLDSFWPLR